jgi:hypothetical protein
VNHSPINWRTYFWKNFDKDVTMNTLFPVLIYEEGIDLPVEGTYFLVSGNGLWMHKDTGIVRAFVPVDNISVLDDFDAKASVGCNLPKLDAKYVWQIKKFFQEVVQRHRSEANVLLYYSKERDDYLLQVPNQAVSHAGVHYLRSGSTQLEGSYLRVGTIHSHCDFGAFHSGTDVGDEEDFDGIHCTFGHNDKDEFTISASVVVNGHRLKVSPQQFLEGIESVKGEVFRLAPATEEQEMEWAKVVPLWMNRIQAVQSSGWSIPATSVEVAEEVAKGDKVIWAGDLSTCSLKTMCGEGPFEVKGVEDGYLVVDTKVGLARFSDKLFMKVE